MNKVAYKSVDELEHFRFDDCQINTFAVTENGVELMVEALIVRADNSQNTNYTERYDEDPDNRWKTDPVCA